MRRILSGIVDLVFPPRCSGCGGFLEPRGPLPFCPPCVAGLRFIGSPLCPRCGTPFPVADGEDHLCGECLATERPYALARSLGWYEGPLLQAIHRFKYRGQTALGETLGGMMADFSARLWERPAFDLVLPVPLHRKRLRERGFNQALILARGISRRSGIPLDFTSLRRQRMTAPQVGLGSKERQANVRDAFSVTRPERVAGRRILLVDDVHTTGSTLSECARVLNRADADAVAVLTLARAVNLRDQPGDGGGRPEGGAGPLAV